MRLALFSDTFLPQSNGVSHMLRRLVDETQARGGSVRVYTASVPGVAPSDGRIVRRFPSVPCPFDPELRISRPTTDAIVRDLREYQPDLVHAATPFGLGLAGLRASRALRIPLVTSYHTNFSAYAQLHRLSALRSPVWRYLRWFHDSGRRTFCPSQAALHDLRGRGFRRLAMWSGGVDSTRFDPAHRARAVRRWLGVGDDGLVVAYAGRIRREKGLDTLLSAMACLRHLRSDLVFAFAGDGPYLDHCRRVAPGRAVFLGRLEGEELSTFYASSDIAVFPSSIDTFGNALVESMASGLPVVAADCAATREILGAAGTYHAAGDGAQLANAIIELVVNPARRNALARVSRLRARQFDMRHSFDGLFAEYEVVLGEPERVADTATRRPHRALAPQSPR